MIELILISIWIACGFISYGLSFAYSFREWPMLEERRLSHVVMGICGPVGLAANIMAISLREGKNIFKHGFKL